MRLAPPGVLRAARACCRAWPARSGAVARALACKSLLLLLAGCAALPWTGLSRDRSSGTSEPGPDGWLDLRGVVHVHTSGSHDSPGTLDDVLEAARRAGVVWIGLTEHTRPGTLSRWGRIGEVTVLPGYEVRAARGSILALGVHERPPASPNPAALVDWIHARGGLAFVGHFESSALADRDAWRSVEPDGLELVNLHAAAGEQSWSLGLRMLLLPAPLALRGLLQVPARNLARWNRIPEARTIVAGLDAHARFRLLGPLGGTFDRYRDTFRLLTTHVLARDAELPSILDALRAGRSYVAFEGLGAVDGFRFERRDSGWSLAAPRAARLVLVCDGEPVDALRAERALLAAPRGAQRCRGEAWLGRRLWIVTSYQDAARSVARSSDGGER